MRCAPRHPVEVLFVDDGSPDGTGARIRELRATRPWINILECEGRQGLGSAYRAGFRWALANGYRRIGEMDADLSHDPAYLPALDAAVRDGAQLALGSRYTRGGGSEGWPLHRRILLRGANLFARTLLRLPHARTSPEASGVRPRGDRSPARAGHRVRRLRVPGRRRVRGEPSGYAPSLRSRSRSVTGHMGGRRCHVRSSGRPPAAASRWRSSDPVPPGGIGTGPGRGRPMATSTQSTARPDHPRWTIPRLPRRGYRPRRESARLLDADRRVRPVLPSGSSRDPVLDGVELRAPRAASCSTAAGRAAGRASAGTP